MGYTPCRTLLIVGPKPPPIGGSPITVQAILDELTCHPSIHVNLINTSPTSDVRKEMTGFHIEKVTRSAAIFLGFIREIGGADAILVFANDFFAITIVPVLFIIARLFRKRFFIKPVGASLDLYIASLPKWLRAYLLRCLRSADGILAQTRVLKQALEDFGCANVHYVPGCRPVLRVGKLRSASTQEFRLVFLAHIVRVKGPLVLLEALRMLAATCARPITCDFYGPIHDEIRGDFLLSLDSTANARYQGVADPGSGSQLIAGYDALVLPTFFDQEGHPGVLIEAMQAGVPVIATPIRSISDLVVHGENGLLVPMHDSRGLAKAVEQLALDPGLMEKMSRASRRKGTEFRADVVVPQLLQIIFPERDVRTC